MNEDTNQTYEVITHTEETSKFYLTELERVTSERDHARNSLEAFKWEHGKRGEIINAVTARIQQEFDEGGWDEEDQFLRDLAELLPDLNIETTEETEIEIVARWYVTVTHPKGMNLADISVDVNEPGLDGDDCEFGYVQFQETEINEL